MAAARAGRLIRVTDRPSVPPLRRSRRSEAAPGPVITKALRPATDQSARRRWLLPFRSGSRSSMRIGVGELLVVLSRQRPRGYRKYPLRLLRRNWGVHLYSIACLIFPTIIGKLRTYASPSQLATGVSIAGWQLRRGATRSRTQLARLGSRQRR